MSTLADFKDSSKLNESLLEGEKILWKGRPETFPLVVPANKKGMFIRWLACAVVFAALTVCYSLAVSANESLEFNLVVEAVILLVCAYAALLPAIDRNKILKKCKYYVTGDRVIVAVGDNDVYALSRKGLKVLRVPGEAGCVTLLFGSHTAQPARKRRVGAFVPGKDEKGELVTGISFYNIRDDGEIGSFFPA